jgi:hypothetical protein
LLDLVAISLESLKMPPGIVPAVRLAEPLEKGQTTIQAALTGGLSYIRPPRPGPTPKDSSRILNTILGRRLIGGDNEKFVQQLFAGIHISQAIDSESSNRDIVEGQALEDNDEGDTDYEPTKRYKYNREHKLATIKYFQTT